ncbi:MAG: hypothetical protein RMK45_09435 [Armatimonadota bacterium]|nr:hypothetical protein [Armatimonadota bacterium]
MRGWQGVLLVALLLGQTPSVGWREAFSKPRCSVAWCKCRSCAGGTQCCCAKARSPLEQVVLQSHCDRAEREQLAPMAALPMTTTPAVAVSLPRFVFLPYRALSLSPLTRPIVPRSPPPEASFKQFSL